MAGKDSPGSRDRDLRDERREHRDRDKPRKDRRHHGESWRARALGANDGSRAEPDGW